MFQSPGASYIKHCTKFIIKVYIIQSTLFVGCERICIYVLLICTWKLCRPMHILMRIWCARSVYTSGLWCKMLKKWSEHQIIVWKNHPFERKLSTKVKCTVICLRKYNDMAFDLLESQCYSVSLFFNIFVLIKIFIFVFIIWLFNCFVILFF